MFVEFIIREKERLNKEIEKKSKKLSKFVPFLSKQGTENLTSMLNSMKAKMNLLPKEGKDKDKEKDKDKDGKETKEIKKKQQQQQHQGEIQKVNYIDQYHVNLNFKVFKKQFNMYFVKWYEDDVYDENDQLVEDGIDGYDDDGLDEGYTRYRYESLYDYYTYGEQGEERYMYEENYETNKLFDNMTTNVPEEKLTDVDYDWPELGFEEIEQIQNEVCICARGQSDDVTCACCLGDCMYISH